MRPWIGPGRREDRRRGRSGTSQPGRAPVLSGATWLYKWKSGMISESEFDQAEEEILRRLSLAGLAGRDTRL